MPAPIALLLGVIMPVASHRGAVTVVAVDALELPPLYEGTLWDYMERAALSMVNSPSDA